MKPKVSIIVATGKNREIGAKNKLLWKIPEELKRFKEITTGHPIIMGRKTYQSIGRPLPNRINIIITRDPNSLLHPKGVGTNLVVVNSLDEAIQSASKVILEGAQRPMSEAPLRVGSTIKDSIASFQNDEGREEIFIIGGGQIYNQAVPLADKLYLTVVDESFPEADTFFPDYSDFKKVILEKEVEVEGEKEGMKRTFKIKFLELER